MLTFFVLFFQLLAILLGIYIMSERNFGAKLFMLMFIFSQILGCLLYFTLGIIGVFSVLIFFILCLSLKTKKIIPSIIIPCLTTILFVLSDYGAQILLHQVEVQAPLNINSDLKLLLTLGIQFILIIAASLFLRYIFKKFQIYNFLEGVYGKMIIAFLIFTIVIFYINIFIGQQQGFSYENVRANGILFIFYTILLFTTFIILIRSAANNFRMENERIQNEQLREYTEALELQYDEIRKFRHDYINILSTMSAYLSLNDLEKLKKYFSEKIIPIGQKFESNNYQLGALSKVKVQEVKGIVSNKIIKAQDLNISTVVDIAEPIEELHVDTMKLCRSLGIILDNAIEEAVLCDYPRLEIAFVEKENLHIIIVKNSCREVPPIHQIYKKGFSTKGENRGLGLANLREILSECEGVTLDTYISEDGSFVQEIGIAY